MNIQAAAPPHLLEQAKTLYRDRNYGALLNQFDTPNANETVRAEPELAILIVSSLDQQFRFADAADAIKRFDHLILLAGNEGLARRWRNLHAGQLIRIGQLARSEVLLTFTLSEAEEHGDSRAAVIAANGLGIVASIRGQVEDALRFYSRAVNAALQRGDSLNVGRSRHNMAVVLREWGYLEASARNFAVASDYFQRQGTIQEVVFLTAERSLLHLRLGDRLLADSLSEFSLRRARLLQSPFLLASSLKCRAVVLAERGFPVIAENLLHEAERVLGPSGDPLIRAEILEELAVVAASQQSDVSGRLEEAEQVYVQLGAPRQVERMWLRIEAISAGCATEGGDEPGPSR